MGWKDAHGAMNDILDQSEIDALLSNSGAAEDEETSSGPMVYGRSGRIADMSEVRPYDFKRPERVSKDQMRSIETLHEAFARIFGASLSGFLRTIVEVKVATCDQMTYAELIASLPNPTSFTMLDVSPMDGTMCLEISPLIIYPIIDRLLGGTNLELFIPQRPLTMIETKLIDKVITRAIEALEEAWEGIHELKLDLAGSESNPHLVQIVPPNEVVIVVSFEIKMGTRAGTMNLCIPFNVIESVIDDLAAQSWFSVGHSESGSSYSNRISTHLSRATLEVSGVLAETTITVDDLVNLSVGDLIVTEQASTKPATVSVEGECKYKAQIGTHKGARALKITDRIESPRDEEPIIKPSGRRAGARDSTSDASPTTPESNDQPDSSIADSTDGAN